MNRFRMSLAALALSSALLTACNGSSGTNYEALKAAFADCSQESVAHLAYVVYALSSACTEAWRNILPSSKSIFNQFTLINTNKRISYTAQFTFSLITVSVP